MTEINYEDFIALDNIDLNDNDILLNFFEYLSDNGKIEENISYNKKLFQELKVLNSKLFDKFIFEEEFLDIIKCATKEAIILAVLNLSLNNFIKSDSYEQIFYKLNKNKEIKKNIDFFITNKYNYLENKIILQKEILKFINQYEKEIYSTIVSKNKKLSQNIENNQTINRKDIFFKLIDCR